MVLDQEWEQGMEYLTSVLFEKALEINQDVYICFIDYTKAFDTVKHNMMIECLTELGIPNKESQIITELDIGKNEQ